MSSRYGERGHGRYGEPEDDRTEDRYQERDAERGYGPPGGRPERGPDYGLSRRGGYNATRGGGYGREYGQGRDYDAREYGSRDLGSRHDARDPGTRDYGSRYGREVFERGGYAGSARRQEGDDYGRGYGVRVYGRNYERRDERPFKRDDDERDEVRDYDTDYGRTTSRFYGRSGYEYGRDDYESDRGDDRDRRVARGRADDDREGGSWLDRAADHVRSWFGGDDDERGHGDDARRAYGRGDGKFRGRGPKNYRRSDDRLREEVCDRLTDNEWLDASDVEVNVVAAEVILTGVVDSRYAKRLAENIAESVSGVSNVQNNLRVQNYQAGPEAPRASLEAQLAGMNTPLPAATPATDITATTDTTDIDDIGRTSSRAAGQS
ncbi:MAG: BON domain-containing protein [Pyrinomonadaceae bacterium]